MPTTMTSLILALSCALICLLSLFSALWCLEAHQWLGLAASVLSLFLFAAIGWVVTCLAGAAMPDHPSRPKEDTKTTGRREWP